MGKSCSTGLRAASPWMGNPCLYKEILYDTDVVGHINREKAAPFFLLQKNHPPYGGRHAGDGFFLFVVYVLRGLVAKADAYVLGGTDHVQIGGDKL